MAGTRQGDRHEQRRFITRHHVEDAAASGQPVRVQGRDILTDEAAQRARDLGVTVERDQGVRPPPGSAPKPASPRPADGAPPDPVLRRAVRAAVVAELGAEPAGLDDVIERVLTSRLR